MSPSTDQVLGGLLRGSTPFLFFTGKGGVGKTSTAAATAIGMADAGHSVLVVSTDPASNLDEVLQTRAGRDPRPVPGVAGLHVMNIDPGEAAAQYREKVLGPYRDSLPTSAVEQIEEQLSGACTVEIAAFNEFVALLTDPAIRERFDHVVFDTAPTGHTLRLLSLPSAWSDFLATNPGGASCIGPLAELGAQQQRYGEAMGALADAGQTTLALVTRPEQGALAEAGRASTELRDLGIDNQRLIVNGVFSAMREEDPLAMAWQQRGQEALEHMPESLAEITVIESVPLLPALPVGVSGLRAMLDPTPVAETAASASTPLQAGLDTDLHGLVDEVAASGRGLVMTMGKGGVGKTTIAAAVATELARRGHPVTLTTTDPAAHVDSVVGETSGDLKVTRIDPAAVTAAHTESVLAEAGAHLDEQGRDLLVEDLRSPCTEEIAVFHAFARTVAAASDRFVVVDTAPTGHTLLLLDASRSYQQQLSQQTGQAPPPEAVALLDRLTDPDYTRILLVSLPEATPVHEAAALQGDLARAGIKPFAWVINQSLAAASPSDPLLLARAASERRYLTEVATEHADRTAVLPWRPVVPAGAEQLALLAGGN
ncbi:arsenical pump-driving ATPase [Allosaccharopolyspora coralli]|uniref:Arsenical pump-driving ATPase n=1 Tax=Allosaccharopolyspora coralli TaxID=2665642 RepID=A0A5Q3Q694_9PSEU|nr:arsenical pump-driving ATPase [Allosaccharopolyspora coralli]QGK68694.1 arsenical pump-driving ATPase [Allosaccharopolyspora coralli]